MILPVCLCFFISVAIPVEGVCCIVIVFFFSGFIYYYNIIVLFQWLYQLKVFDDVDFFLTVPNLGQKFEAVHNKFMVSEIILFIDRFITISETFCDYFTNIGQLRSNKIPKSRSHDFSSYHGKHSANSLFFTTVIASDIISIQGQET